MENNNEIKNLLGTFAASDVAKLAQKFSETAYLEAIKPKELQNRAVVEGNYNGAIRMTNLLIESGYWKKSVILGG